MTKKVFFSFSLLMPVMLILSCAGNKPAVYQQQPVTEQPKTDEAESYTQYDEEGIYEYYSGRVILEGSKTYLVVWGDTLTKIAKKQYGSGNGYYFPLILLASRDMITDPDVIIPRTVLTIPDLQRNLDDPGARQQLKGFLYDVAEIYNGKLRKTWGAQTRNQLRVLAATL